MASLGDVSRYLRQRRAVGKPITDLDRSAAWNAYFDTEATKQIQRGELALKTRSLDITERQNAELLRLQSEEQDAAEKAGMISGAVQLGQLGSMAYKGSQTALGKKAIAGVKGLFGSAQGGASATVANPAAATVASQVGAQGAAAGVGAQGAAVSSLGSDLAGVSTQLADKSAMLGTPASTTAGTSSGGSLVMPGAIGFAAGDMASSAMMRSEKMQKFAEKTSFGILHAKKDASFAAGIGAGAAAGSMFGPVGAVIGGVLGGAAAAIKNTWLCTKTKELVGMTEHEWETIGQFREYALENHSDWLNVYVDIGPALLEKINGDEEFYSNLKDKFIDPVIKLTDGGFMEAAYLTYKSVVMDLIDKYDPELTKEYPEVA